MTPNEIKSLGYEPITSEQQLRELKDGFYLLLHESGAEYRYVKSGGMFGGPSVFWRCEELKITAAVGFRHVPDAVPEVEAADGFEKKTEFARTLLSDLLHSSNHLTISMAKHIRYCHAHIDQQAAENDRLRDEASKWETTSMAVDNQLTRANGEIARLDRLASDTQNELDKAVEEIEALKAGREWVAIENAEQLRSLPNGTYEFIRNGGELDVKLKEGSDFNWGNVLVANACTHYRLITAASDFTPPERKFKLNGEYSRAEIMELLGENE